MHSSLYTPSRQIDWVTRCDLSTAARLVAEIYDRAPRHAPEAWWSVHRVAAAIGKSVRTVQVATKELIAKGLVAYVRDYSLKGRRRIVLLWRKPAEQPNPEPRIDPEPTEGAMRHVPADLRRDVEPVRPAAAPPAAQVDAPRVRDEAPAEGRKATPEEVERVVSEAAKVPGSTRAKALRLARACRLSTVDAAVRRALARGMGWGWVTATARAWAVEGIPEYATEAPKEDDLTAAMRLFGPGGQFSEPNWDYIKVFAGVDLNKEF